MGAISIDTIKWNINEIKSQAMRLYFSCLPLATMRMRFLRRHKIFAELGENVHFQPRRYPVDADRIRIHNNVAIATNVTFYLHDISWMVLEKLTPPEKIKVSSV